MQLFHRYDKSEIVYLSLLTVYCTKKKRPATGQNIGQQPPHSSKTPLDNIRVINIRKQPLHSSKTPMDNIRTTDRSTAFGQKVTTHQAELTQRHTAVT
jgi:hypothetical protein